MNIAQNCSYTISIEKCQLRGKKIIKEKTKILYCPEINPHTQSPNL